MKSNNPHFTDGEGVVGWLDIANKNTGLPPKIKINHKKIYKKNTGLPVKFKFQINNNFYFIYFFFLAQARPKYWDPRCLVFYVATLRKQGLV